MSKHTPGPWKEGPSQGALKKEVLNEPGNRCIATVFVKHYHKMTGSPVVWPEGEANLKAILALPDLVAALKALIAWLGPLHDQGQQVGNLDMALINRARAALANCGAELEAEDEMDGS